MISTLKGLPKNASPTALLDNTVFIGSLSGGVWKKDLTNENQTPQRTGLDQLQIWKLKTVEIK